MVKKTSIFSEIKNNIATSDPKDRIVGRTTFWKKSNAEYSDKMQLMYKEALQDGGQYSVAVAALIDSFVTSNRRVLIITRAGLLSAITDNKNIPKNKRIGIDNAKYSDFLYYIVNSKIVTKLGSSSIKNRYPVGYYGLEVKGALELISSTRSINEEILDITFSWSDNQVSDESINKESPILQQKDNPLPKQEIESKQTKAISASPDQEAQPITDEMRYRVIANCHKINHIYSFNFESINHDHTSMIEDFAQKEASESKVNIKILMSKISSAYEIETAMTAYLSYIGLYGPVVSEAEYEGLIRSHFYNDKLASKRDTYLAFLSRLYGKSLDKYKTNIRLAADKVRKIKEYQSPARIAQNTDPEYALGQMIKGLELEMKARDTGKTIEEVTKEKLDEDRAIVAAIWGPSDPNYIDDDEDGPVEWSIPEGETPKVYKWMPDTV